jgi:hypothetical protein
MISPPKPSPRKTGITYSALTVRFIDIILIQSICCCPPTRNAQCISSEIICEEGRRYLPKLSKILF